MIKSSFGILINIILFFCYSHTQPKIEVAEGTNIDFGEVFSGNKISKDLNIRNVGTDTLRIASVNTGCGCTATLLSEKNIAPGDSGKLKISFDSRGFSGKVTKHVSIQSNDTKSPNLSIAFNVNIITILTLNPQFLSFHNIKVDSAYKQTVTITNTGKQQVKILSVDPQSKDFKTALMKNQLMPGEQTSMLVTFEPKKLGVSNGAIQMIFVHPDTQRIEIRYFTNVNQTK